MRESWLGVQGGSDQMLNEDLVVVRSKPGWSAGKARHEEASCLHAWKEGGCPGVRGDTSVLGHGKEVRYLN